MCLNVSDSLNRTFMELKQKMNTRTGRDQLGLNRTFMELKLYQGGKDFGQVVRS